MGSRQSVKGLGLDLARMLGRKDGVVKRVFEAVNPVGCRVVPFKVPTPIERAHDYLWRIHPHMPASGEIVITGTPC